MRDNLTPEQKEFMQQYIFAMQNKIENLELSNATYQQTIIHLENEVKRLEDNMRWLDSMYNQLQMKVDNILFSFQNMSNAVFSGRSAN